MSKLKNKNINIENNLIPINLNTSFDIVKDSYSFGIGNAFIVFKSINDILYLIYSNKKNSIISYNLVNNKIINKIKNAHEKEIICIKYYLDKINKRDLILSISGSDNNIKIWNINNYEFLINIKNINNERGFFSACFLNDINKIYIITSKGNYFGLTHLDSIKVYDLKGDKIKEINDSKDNSFLIDSYYDNKYFKNYIITGNNGYVKSYDYEQNTLYHKYYENNNDSNFHLSKVINEKEEIVELIETCYNGNIRIWNFHSGELLNKINITSKFFYSICLYNNEYLFIGCGSNTIILIDLNEGIIIKELEGHKNNIITIKKIIHPKYGECLISQGSGDDGIKLWINKKKFLSKTLVI